MVVCDTIESNYIYSCFGGHNFICFLCCKQ